MTAEESAERESGQLGGIPILPSCPFFMPSGNPPDPPITSHHSVAGDADTEDFDQVSETSDCRETDAPNTFLRSDRRSLPATATDGGSSSGRIRSQHRDRDCR